MVRNGRLACRLLWRERRSADIRILVLALVIAVASTSAVGFFTDRAGRLLTFQANELLGADLVMSSDRPFAPSWIRQAARFSLDTAEAVVFPSMALANGKSALASVKAVSVNYPLRGQLRIAGALFAPDRPAQTAPAAGTVWLEPRLAAALQVAVGDRIQLGSTSLEVGAILTHEPARAGGNLFSIAPRLLLRVEDLPATGLIHPASRVQYQLLFAGQVDAVARFRHTVAGNAGDGVRMNDVRDARPEIRTALQRAERFLGLAALTAVLLAGVAIAMAARRYVARHRDSWALLRCFGTPQRQIEVLFGWQLLMLAVAGSGLGCALGYGGQAVLVAVLGDWLDVSLPPASLRPLWAGLGTGLITLLGFALPPLLTLKRVPPMRVLRREMSRPSGSAWAVYGSGAMALVVLIVWQAGNSRLTLYVLLGLTVTIAVLAGWAWLMLRWLPSLLGRLPFSWRHGLANVARRPGTGTVQIVAVGSGVMVLLMLHLIRGDLVGQWQDRLPDDAPNRFLINIQPDQTEAVRRFIMTAIDEPPPLYPMVRARLVAVNGTPRGPADYEDEHARRLISRAFNLSWSEGIAADNRVVAGRWWRSPEERMFSVEKGLAETLGLKLGDRLHFNVAGEEVVAPVGSLREVDWDSFNVNFFVIAPPALLSEYPTSYITSIYLPPSDYQVLNELLQRFPNITVIDVAAVMTHVRNMIDHVVLAVQFVFLFTLAAGMVVLVAALQTTLTERIQEIAVMRTLGASRTLVCQSIIGEFLFIGVLAGIIGSVGAAVCALVVAQNVFHSGYWPAPSVLLLGVSAAALGTVGVGLAGARPLLKTPPLMVLRG